MSEMSTISQTTNRILLIRPRNFGFNEETAESSGFQEAPSDTTDTNKIRDDAINEFDQLKTLLESCGILVNEESDRDDKQLPDSVFPNNWLSFHTSRTPSTAQPTMVLYPMMATKRRQERQDSVIRKWQEELHADIVDMSKFENDGIFLEGTGSMVLDHSNRIAYACVSSRTSPLLVETFCEKLGYKPIIFNATKFVKDSLFPIYHTNVMMSIGEEFALVCLDSIRDDSEKQLVKDSLEKSRKRIIPITEHQMNEFVGNALQLRNHGNTHYLFMSTKAYNALEEWQRIEISKSNTIVHTAVDVIEKYGGGGVRCMIAEIFPPL